MNTETTRYFLANTRKQLSEVYSLRYACYRRQGSIDERADGQFSDTFDEKPNSFSFLMDRDGKLSATVRVTVVRPDLGWDDAPVHHVYGDHPAFTDIARTSFVESSRLCFEQQARHDMFVGLVGHMAALAEFYCVEWLVACPRVEHAPVYQRMFGFRPLAEPRQYFGVKFKTQLLGLRVRELAEHASSHKSMRAAWSSALASLTARASRQNQNEISVRKLSIYVDTAPGDIRHVDRLAVL